MFLHIHLYHVYTNMEGVFVFIIIFNYYITYKVIIYNVQGRKGWTVELLVTN